VNNDIDSVDYLVLYLAMLEGYITYTEDNGALRPRKLLVDGNKYSIIQGCRDKDKINGQHPVMYGR